MRFENSPFQDSLLNEKKELDFANLYLCEDFFIMEVNEGIHFDKSKLDQMIDSLRNHYGNHKRLAYIANRVNSYSIEPIIWSYFDEDDSILIAASIVSYRDSTYMNAGIEKQLATISIKRAHSLERAIDWVKDLEELN